MEISWMRSGRSLALIGIIAIACLAGCDSGEEEQPNPECYPDEHLSDSQNCACNGPCATGTVCTEGECVPLCGDGQCRSAHNENCETCPLDCGECCGDDLCNEGQGENCLTCPEDCNDCCGNGFCDNPFGENCESCEPDCKCTPGTTCHEAHCCTPACQGLECGDDGCGGDCGLCGCAEECEGGACSFHGCDDKTCGPDGCGGSCGLCDACTEACVDGACVFEDPCNGKQCGEGICGEFCGECPCWAPCDAAFGVCVEVDLCDGKDCGLIHGCNEITCGECQGDLHCSVDNKCVDECTQQDPDWFTCSSMCCNTAEGEVCIGGVCCAPQFELVCKSDTEVWSKDSCGNWEDVVSECQSCCKDGECVNTLVNCGGKECGPDGCGGFCGLDCVDQEGCGHDCVDGQCEWTACEEKDCGPDGCGGTCGICEEGLFCTNGACTPPVCGNGTCEAPYEDCWTCPADCPGTGECEPSTTHPDGCGCNGWGVVTCNDQCGWNECDDPECCFGYQCGQCFDCVAGVCAISNLVDCAPGLVQACSTNNSTDCGYMECTADCEWTGDCIEPGCCSTNDCDYPCKFCDLTDAGCGLIQHEDGSFEFLECDCEWNPENVCQPAGKTQSCSCNDWGSQTCSSECTWGICQEPECCSQGAQDVCAAKHKCDQGTCVNTCGTGGCEEQFGENCSNCSDCACTGINICHNNTCKNPCAIANCNDGNPCTTDSCDSQTGQCQFPPKPAGANCGTMQKCTASQQCIGTCGSGGCEADHGENCSISSCPGDCPCPPGEECTGTSCGACGDLGEACCGESSCNGPWICNSGMCSSCGGQGEPCCPAGQPCNGDLECTGSICGACGDLQQPCCGGSSCNNSSWVCHAGNCSTCGNGGDPCCQDGPPCTGDLECSGGTCGSPPCGGSCPQCQKCVNNSCVQDDALEGEDCFGQPTLSVCKNGECVPCGNTDQPCCGPMHWGYLGQYLPFCNNAMYMTRTCIDGICEECGGFLKPCCAEAGPQNSCWQLSTMECIDGTCLEITCSSDSECPECTHCFLGLGICYVDIDGTSCTGGTCEDGKCSAQDCPGTPDCNNHGTCNNGSCSCYTGFKGTSCDECDTGSGYTGYPNCTAVVDCPGDPDCNNHGSCINGSCSCDTGYTGSSCNMCQSSYSTCGSQCCPGSQTCCSGSCCLAGYKCFNGSCCPPQCQGECAGAPDECGGVCPSNNCDGCCDIDHVCRDGVTKWYCGMNGEDCDQCASQCVDGQCSQPSCLSGEFVCNIEIQYLECEPGCNMMVKVQFDYESQYNTDPYIICVTHWDQDYSSHDYLGGQCGETSNSVDTHASYLWSPDWSYAGYLENENQPEHVIKISLYTNISTALANMDTWSQASSTKKTEIDNGSAPIDADSCECL